MKEEFHPHKTPMARYLVYYSLGNCVMKLCIETGLKSLLAILFLTFSAPVGA